MKKIHWLCAGFYAAVNLGKAVKSWKKSPERCRQPVLILYVSVRERERALLINDVIESQ